MRSLLAKPAFRIAAMIVISVVVGLAVAVEYSNREVADHQAWMKDSVDLRDVWTGYRGLQDELGRPPTSEELLDLLDKRKPDLAQRLRSDELVIRWSVRLSGSMTEDREIVLGYSTIRTRRGYAALRGDGTSNWNIQELPAE